MTITTARPVSDRVLIERIAPPEKTRGGLWIPDTAKEPEPEGIVLAVGPGRTFDNGVHVEPQVKVGDRVVFDKHAGSDVVIDGKKLVIMAEWFILGVVEP